MYLQIIQELGCGGCGIVYEVEGICGKNTGKRAAMKAETVDATGNYSETLTAEVVLIKQNEKSF